MFDRVSNEPVHTSPEIWLVPKILTLKIIQTAEIFQEIKLL